MFSNSLKTHQFEEIGLEIKSQDTFTVNTYIYIYIVYNIYIYSILYLLVKCSLFVKENFYLSLHCVNSESSAFDECQLCDDRAESINHIIGKYCKRAKKKSVKLDSTG